MSRYPTPVVRVVVRRADGRVLVRKGQDGWDLPGQRFEGGKDWNASTADCLAGLGLKAASAKLTGIYTATQPEPAVIAVFLAESGLSTSPLADSEWVTLDALPEAMPGFARQGIIDACEFRGEVFSR